MKAVLGVMGTLALITALLYCAIALSAFDIGFYEEQYGRLGVSEAIKIEKSELLAVTVHMLDYLADRNDDLRIAAVIDGSTSEFFNSKELSHMVDVKKLFSIGRALKNLCFCVFAAAFIYIVKEAGYGFAAKVFLITLISFVAVLVLVSLAVYLDFDHAFTVFHNVFFSNDLWMLDPETDLLINIVPLGFFMDIAKRIAVVLSAFLGALITVGAAGTYFALRNQTGHWR